MDIHQPTATELRDLVMDNNMLQRREAKKLRHHSLNAVRTRVGKSGNARKSAVIAGNDHVGRNELSSGHHMSNHLECFLIFGTIAIDGISSVE